ncbi:hypothetical protein [Cellulomonas carbonis]|nr:hypothetical protein [Cellulomonas carbonis]MDT0167177.1 hypothetical protein [Actinotalea sp. AC32]GGC13043.1 hypothetical protein GCM10010972_27990 [Cellulomonas carbonis]
MRAACLADVLERVCAVDGVARVGLSLNRAGRSRMTVHCARWVETGELRRAVSADGAFQVAEPAGTDAGALIHGRVAYAAERFATGSIQ